MVRTLGPLLGWEVAPHDEAWTRAEALLRDSLTPEQLHSYETYGYVEVASASRPGRVYRVDGWRPVAAFDDGDFAGAVCIRPREHLPGPDIILARKLMIEGAEEDFLRRGNWLSPAVRPVKTLPSLLMLAVVLSPWIIQAVRLAPAAFVTVVAVVALVAAAVRKWRSCRGADATATLET